VPETKSLEESAKSIIAREGNIKDNEGGDPEREGQDTELAPGEHPDPDSGEHPDPNTDVQVILSELNFEEIDASTER
jgi:hypothetical protein